MEGAVAHGLGETRAFGFVAAHGRDEPHRLVRARVVGELLEQRPRDAATAPLGGGAHADAPRAVRRREEAAVARGSDRLDPTACVFDQQHQAQRLGTGVLHRARCRGRHPLTRRGPAVLELHDALDVGVRALPHAQLRWETLRDGSEIGGHEAADYNR